MFIYDRDSFFANDIVRWIDYALLLVILVLPIAASVHEHPFNLHFVCIIAGALIGIAITGHAVKNTTFFIGEFGEREAEKKVRFAMSYATVAFILCTALLFYLSYLYFVIRAGSDNNMSIWGYVLFIIPPIILIINILNIGSLFYPVFEDDIVM